MSPNVIFKKFFFQVLMFLNSNILYLILLTHVNAQKFLYYPLFLYALGFYINMGTNLVREKDSWSNVAVKIITMLLYCIEIYSAQISINILTILPLFLLMSISYRNILDSVTSSKLAVVVGITLVNFIFLYYFFCGKEKISEDIVGFFLLFSVYFFIFLSDFDIKKNIKWRIEKQYYFRMNSYFIIVSQLLPIITFNALIDFVSKHLNNNLHELLLYERAIAIGSSVAYFAIRVNSNINASVVHAFSAISLISLIFLCFDLSSSFIYLWGSILGSFFSVATVALNKKGKGKLVFSVNLVTCIVIISACFGFYDVTSLKTILLVFLIPQVILLWISIYY